MKQYAVSIDIQASAQQVWAILIDAKQWPQWNPTIEKVEGEVALGQAIKLYTKLSPKRAFALKVNEFSPARRMVWGGGMPMGLFKGEREYLLTPIDAGVRFSMTENFSGLLSSMITKSMPDLQPSFNEFAIALKQKAEARS